MLWIAPNLKVLIFGEKPPCIRLDTFAWENNHAFFTSSRTGEKTGDFQFFLIHLSDTICSDMKNTTGETCGAPFREKIERCNE